jgi:hypothetical protein
MSSEPLFTAGESGCKSFGMIKGQQAWIRIRGAPDDPESFDLATWNGLVWLIPRTNSLGDQIQIQIPDYMIAETMPPETKPEAVYRVPNPSQPKTCEH